MKNQHRAPCKVAPCVDSSIHIRTGNTASNPSTVQSRAGCEVPVLMIYIPPGRGPAAGYVYCSGGIRVDAADRYMCIYPT